MIFLRTALWMIFILHICTINFFLTNGNEIDSEIPSRLLASAQSGDIYGVKEALEANEPIDTININGWSAAMFAAASHDYELMIFLVDKGSNLNIVNNEGYTALMIAASENDKEMVELLLLGNASPFVIAKDGSTAISLAEKSGRKIVIYMLAEAMALHSIDMEEIGLVVQSVRDGAYVNIRNIYGWTPLMIACRSGDLNAVKEIFLFGPDVDRTDNEGFTALHHAAQRGFVKIIQVLIHNKAAVHALSLNGITPLQLAKNEGFREVVDILKEAEIEQRKIMK